MKRGATTSPPGRARYPRPKNPWWLPSHIHRPFQRRLASALAWRRRARRTRDRLRTGARPARARTAQRSRDRCRRRRRRLALEVLGAASAARARQPAQLLADHMFNQGLVLGPRIASADDAPASMTITLSVDGQDAEQHAGIHPTAGPRPVCTGWRTSCVNKAPACAPASMSSLARMPASWTCRRAAISRSPTATWACCACASSAAAGAGARLCCGAGPRACARVTWHTRPRHHADPAPAHGRRPFPPCRLVLQPCRCRPMGRLAALYPLTPLHVETMLSEGRSTPPARRCWMVCRDGAGRTCAARL